MTNKLKFSLVADFHYKKGMYPVVIEDLNAILERAEQEKVEAIFHAGDYSNDYKGSMEVIEPLLNNKMGVPVCGVYGNHELECHNTMDFVTPLLTNAKNAVWGTEDGKVGDGSIAYYYVDIKNFRIICTDTNYSFNKEGFWEHNTVNSYGPRQGNLYGNSLGTKQLNWLEKVLIDSAHQGKKCIVISHDSYSGKFRSTSPDAEHVRRLFACANSIKKGTVLMAINGHIHTNNAEIVNNVFYLDMNTTRNSWWQLKGSEHYSAEHTYNFTEFEDGKAIKTYARSYAQDTMGKNTWCTKDALNAIVTVTEDGEITVEGMESEYVYGILPPETKWNDCEPRVLSGNWKLEV